MPPSEPLYWPFPVISPEQRTDAHRVEIAFFEAAYNEGFRPRINVGVEYEIESGDGRFATMIRRAGSRDGPKPWEVRLESPDAAPVRFIAFGFRNASEQMLDWVRGVDSVQTDQSTAPTLAVPNGQSSCLKMATMNAE